MSGLKKKTRKRAPVDDDDDLAVLPAVANLLDALAKPLARVDADAGGDLKHVATKVRRARERAHRVLEGLTHALGPIDDDEEEP